MSSSGYDRPGAGRYLWVRPQPLLLGRFLLHRAWCIRPGWSTRGSSRSTGLALTVKSIGTSTRVVGQSNASASYQRKKCESLDE